jgi:putative membrane protein
MNEQIDVAGTAGDVATPPRLQGNGPPANVGTSAHTLRAVVRRAEAVLAKALGASQPRQAPADGLDRSTRLAYERTNLGLERTYMATERTLQAWIRTTLAMISFGFTLGKLSQVLHDVEVQGLFRTRTVSITSIAYVLVLLGTAALLAAIVQHWSAVRELRARGLRNRVSIAFVVAILLVALGGFACTALTIKF